MVGEFGVVEMLDYTREQRGWRYSDGHGSEFGLQGERECFGGIACWRGCRGAVRCVGASRGGVAWGWVVVRIVNDDRVDVGRRRDCGRHRGSSTPS